MRVSCTLIAFRDGTKLKKEPTLGLVVRMTGQARGEAMNVIVVSGRTSNARSIALGSRELVLVGAMIALSICLLAAALHYFTLRYAVANNSAYLRPLLESIQAQESERMQSYLGESLKTMAAKVGELQARLVRLDALGDRLSKVAGLKPQEFMFDRPPGQGGADSSIPAHDLSMRQLADELDRLARELEDRGDKLRFLESTLTAEHAKQQLIPNRMPVAAGYFSSGFGWRIDPFNGMNAFHEGLDFTAREGTPILAAAGGVVVFAAAHPQYGNMVEIDHGNGLVTRYAHASRLLVKVGDVVLRGSKIAEVGNTGRSTGTHLHFEVRHRGVAQNPARFLRAPG
jgi:murein DD-endopeptidase MepM/ murein hydrolase activator NlpD